MDLRDPRLYFLDFGLTDILDVLLVTLIIFVALVLVQDTRAIPLVRGILIFAGLLFVLNVIFDLPAVRWLVERAFPALLFALPVIFQPELRRAIDKIGSVSYFRLWRREEAHKPVVSAVAEACRRLANRRHGALIVLEQETGLQEYIDTGVQLNALPSFQLLLTIFQKDTELHDGAVIIRKGVLAAASCIMPLSASLQSDRKMGLRHRAALGTSEVSDAVAIIVSEETGQISIAHNGRMLRRQDPARLEGILTAFMESARNRSD